MIDYSLPIIAALIGWVTNYIAVKMLFHPRKPVSLGFCTVQGVFPKRQKLLATSLVRIVSEELFSTEDLRKVLEQSAHSPEIQHIVEAHVDRFLQQGLTKALPMVSAFLPNSVLGTVKQLIMTEVDGAIQNVILSISENADQHVDIKAVVEEKVSNYSSDKLEDLLFALMSREFRFIELVGGVLGFIIGLLQMAMVHYP